MAKFSLKDSDKYYIELSDNPKRFDADSPVTNVFFDDTNGQVFSVRSGGVTGVTVIGMDDSKSTSFRMEDKGSIVSIKFSPDHNILAIQRNRVASERQTATVEFLNFKDLNPTNVEYTYTCKWKNAEILGFVWSQINEIAFITDCGIELLQVVPEKKQFKSLRITSFGGAWFSWCPQSKIVLLAGNNGALLQPFSLKGSTITKLTKLQLESGRPVSERDVFVLRMYDVTWCAVFRHAATAVAAAATAVGPTGPTEVHLLPVSSGPGGRAVGSHVLRTGLIGRFAVNVLDDLIVVHHQSSQTSLIFDIMEESRSVQEDNTTLHIPVVPAVSMKPTYLGEQICPMYSPNWVAFQPYYMIDARLGAMWRLHLRPDGLAHQVPKQEIPKIVAVLLRRSECKDVIYRILNQLVEDAKDYLVELGQVFDEINDVYRKWADAEIERSTAGSPGAYLGGSGGAPGAGSGAGEGALISQVDMCARVLTNYAEHEYIVQVVTLYLSSLCSRSLPVQTPTAEFCVRALLTRRAAPRLRALLRRGCLTDSRPLACQLLSLGHMDRAAAQLALDMMCRLKAYEEIVEVLLSWDQTVSATGTARQGGVWSTLQPRKILAAAVSSPSAFVAIYHALLARNNRLRGSPDFIKGEQCDTYVEYYKKFTADNINS